MADKVLELFHMVQVRDSLDMDRIAGMYDIRDHDMLVLDGQISLLDKLIAAVEDDEGRGR